LRSTPDVVLFARPHITFFQHFNPIRTLSQMNAAHWINQNLYLGRALIGRVAPDWTPGPNGEHWAGFSHLPGAGLVLGPYADEETARAMVLKSSQSRCKAMFGAGMETTTTAVSEGKALRKVARALFRAGVWTCDRPVNAYALFQDLAQALGIAPEDAPTPNRERLPGEALGSSAEPMPDPVDMIEVA
jgi:hypothetical protein